MSDSIKVELGLTAEPVVTVDYSALAQELLEEVSDSIAEIANEAVDHYMRYEFDISDQVSDQVGDTINDVIDSLLDDVTPGSLCGIGRSFESAVRTLLIHHIDMRQVLLENVGIENNGGISRVVQDAMKKEMVVNISFVDKQPAEVVEVVQETSNSATNLIPGPVDEINTRSENV
jgi:hypothetical protein|tara:strand:- start:597 stop:1121 length:525 start_codon:yes stop_codon:yes gene_type:complete